MGMSPIPRNAPSLGIPSLSVVGLAPVPALTLVQGYSRSLDVSPLSLAGRRVAWCHVLASTGASSEPSLSLTIGGLSPWPRVRSGLTSASALFTGLHTVGITVSLPHAGWG